MCLYFTFTYLKGRERDGGRDLHSQTPAIARSQEAGPPSRSPTRVAGAQGLEPSPAASQGAHEHDTGWQAELAECGPSSTGCGPVRWHGHCPLDPCHEPGRVFSRRGKAERVSALEQCWLPEASLPLFCGPSLWLYFLI